MITNYTNTPITFNAKFGPELQKTLLKNDFSNRKRKLNGYLNEFNNYCKGLVDTNTFIELDKNNHFTMSHPHFPNIVTKFKLFFHKDKSLSEDLLSTFEYLYNKAENEMFRSYITKQYRKGTSLEKIKEHGKTVLSNDRHSDFEYMIDVASEILKNNPKSKLSEDEFLDVIENRLRIFFRSEEFKNLMSQDTKPFDNYA